MGFIKLDIMEMYTLLHKPSFHAFCQFKNVISLTENSSGRDYR